MEKAKETRLYHSIVTIVPMIVIMFVSIVKFGSSPQIPLVFGCMIAGVVAIWIGYTWEDILKGMIDGITNSLEAILILMLIGVLVGSWIASGTVPTLIYYGLKIVSPRIFLPATMFICLLVACAIGSWGTVGTIGIAFMGIGVALQIPAPLVAGAIVSGSYMGEIVSPLSDATNLTAAVVNVDLFKIAKRIFPVAVVGALIALAMYSVIGIQYGAGSAKEVEENISPLLSSLSLQFHISPFTLIPLVVMSVCIYLKVPAVPSMLVGSVAGMIEAVFFQGISVGSMISFAYSGYISDSGNEMIDNLLTAGGMEGMLESISIIIVAMAFGGIMRETKQMEAIVNPIISRVRTYGGMSLVTVITCVFMNLILPDQYLGISMPGQMYDDEYDKRGYERVSLGAILLGGGAVTSPLIPWNTCGIYCMTILGVAPLAYAPYAFFGFIVPVLIVLIGFGITIKRKVKA